MLDAGSIAIDVLTSNGIVVATRIVSSRPRGLSRALIGRGAAETPELVGRLFALCGVAHATASARAVACAAGRTTSAGDLVADAARLTAERLGESLRGTLLAPDVRLGSDTAAALRAALAATRVLASRATPVEREAACAALAQATDALGLPVAGVAPAHGAIAALLDVARADATFDRRSPDALTAHDDRAVIAGLRADRTFAAAPVLPGRIPETGAFARNPHAGQGGGALAARLSARIADMAACRDALSGAADDAFPALVGIDAAATGSGEGYCALESPRGRLYHWARVDDDGRIADYAILAPTEWNFHAAGPFAAALSGAAIGEGALARSRVERLAALFDPCVAFSVSVSESRDA